ncbi:MAG: ATP-dependent DNA helicase [Christensenellales bacterium]
MREERVSVHGLLDAALRRGDLLSGYASMKRLWEGTRGHQRHQGAQGPAYEAEVPLSARFEGELVRLVVEGRADGVYPGPEGAVLEEIKTTGREPEALGPDDAPEHWEQARCYGAMLCRQRGLERLWIKLTYICLPGGQTVSFTRGFEAGALWDFLAGAAGRLLARLEGRERHRRERDRSVQSLPFPFETYRPGQREMAGQVYRAVKGQGTLLVEAPTGIGKTLASLYPALKAMGEGCAEKIFYLTARTPGRQVAAAAIARMRQGGLVARDIVLSAKDKLCFAPEGGCHPARCPYAAGHFDRVDACLERLAALPHIGPEELTEACREHRVCPFETMLDASLSCDVIIGDYNHLFDPRAYLRRYFQDGGGLYAFLIDEAHNLVERGREMFSAALRKADVLALKKRVKADDPGEKRLIRALTGLNAALLALKKRSPDQPAAGVEPPGELEEPLLRLCDAADAALSRQRKPPFAPELMAFYYEALGFARALADYDGERYRTLTDPAGGFSVKLFCLDPSQKLAAGLKRGSSAVLFSATLSPVDYYRELIGVPEAPWMRLASPFDPERLLLLAADRVSTRYADRERTLPEVAGMIAAAYRAKPGNYLAFFPSFAYLSRAAERLAREEDLPLHIQGKGLSEAERAAYLEAFAPGGRLLGLAVMGGVFGEGVDLAGERLIGVMIVGVGLPQVCLQVDCLRDYFTKRGRRGFDYAYAYPGMRRVLQAMGRVIRDEGDRGIALLIDERFRQSPYRELLGREPGLVASPRGVTEALAEFWRGQGPGDVVE